nr:hypothetical protein [Tanacetum cinerariifolium]
KDHFEIVTNSNDDISSSDDDSLYNENIEYVEASPHDSEVVSLEVAEIVIPEEEEIKNDNLREKLLNVHLLIANIEAVKDNPTPSSKSLTKSSSTSSKSFLEETNTLHNSLPEFENFYFDFEEISSGSTTTHSDISLPDYEAFSFNNDHIKEISSGSTTTHSDISLSEYDSFTFDLSNDHCPPTDRSDFTHEEFADELGHIISPLEYDRFYFWNLLDPGELMSILNSKIRENLSTTCVNLPVEDDHSPLLAYVVWIFLSYLTYPVIPLYLHPFGNEDTIFDPGITINRFCSFKPGLSHRCGAFKKFKTHHEPASPLRDFSQCEACPTDSSFGADQDMANIAKTSTFPHDSASRVTSFVADEGSMQQTLDELTTLCTSLQRQHSEMGRNLDEGEEVAERVSDDTEEMATILTSMDAATVLASGVAEVFIGNGSIPTAVPPAAEVPTGSDVVPTAGLNFATANVVTPYTRRKGKETMVESETLKKKKVDRTLSTLF